MKNSGHRTWQYLEVGWLTLVIVVPICFNPLAIEPFETPKSIVVCVLTPVLLGIFVIDYFVRWRLKFQGSAESVWKDALGKRNGLTIPFIGGFVLTYGFASILSIDTKVSLWNPLQPTSSLVVMLCYVSVFLIIMQHGRRPFQQHRIVVAVIAASIPIVMYGFVQALDKDIFVWRTDSVSIVLSTLGRSNFLGAYLVMVIPMTMYLFASTKRRTTKMSCGVLFGLQSTCLLLTGARAAWLAFLIALIVFSLVVRRNITFARNRRSMLSGGVLALFLIVLGLVCLNIYSNDSVRMVSIVDRIYLWIATARLIADRWILGYGPGTFYQVFPAYYPEILRMPEHAPFFLNPHNLVLELAASIGLIGLFTYVCLIGRVYYLGLYVARNCIDDKQRLFLSACLASIAGFHVSGLFTSGTVTTELLFWVLAALILGCAKQEILDRHEEKQSDARGFS